MSDPNDVGGRIRQIRGSRTQDEFAELIGVARKTLIRYEANERDPDLDFILKMNLLFKVQPLWLLAGQMEPTSGVQLAPDAAELVGSYERCSAHDKGVLRRVARGLALIPNSASTVDGDRDRASGAARLAALKAQKKTKKAERLKAFRAEPTAEEASISNVTASGKGTIAIGSIRGGTQNLKSGKS